MACTKMIAVELMKVSGLWGLNHWTVKELLYILVFGVRDDLGIIGKKNK